MTVLGLGSSLLVIIIIIAMYLLFRFHQHQDHLFFPTLRYSHVFSELYQVRIHKFLGLYKP